MDLRQLGYLIRIVECGSFSRAAQALNVAQPSLSQRMKDLEQELGAELLHRSSSGVRPTDVGLMVVDRSRAILKQVEQLKQEVRGSTGSPTGHVTVGLPTTMALHLTVPLVQSVLQRYPGVNLHIIEGMSGHIQEWTLSGRVDIALLYSADPVAGLEQQLLLTEDLYLMAAHNKHHGNLTPLTLAEVAQLPLVLPGRDHGLRRNIERIATDAKVVLNVPVEVDSLTQMKRLVIDSDLFTILPWAACREEIRVESVVARRIVAPVLRRPVVIAVGSDRPLSVAARCVFKLTSDLVAAALASSKPPKVKP
jgi:LysR family transcriptional regulator, nitrogen assimilation regulatory protein